MVTGLPGYRAVVAEAVAAGRILTPTVLPGVLSTGRAPDDAVKE